MSRTRSEKITEKNIALWIKMRKEGRSYNQIAAISGMPPSAIRYWANESYRRAHSTLVMNRYRRLKEQGICHMCGGKLPTHNG